MTYNEWRDELKSNLLSVTESERRRVLDYYAEAYADRRDAGYTEREIIEDFGAPYDAAQRILAENSSYDYYDDLSTGNRKENVRQRREELREEKFRRREERREERVSRERGGRNNEYTDEYYDDLRDDYKDDSDKRRRRPAERIEKCRDDYTWVFVILCIAFSIPIFILVMAMVGITVGLCVAPVGVLIGGVATVGAGIGALFSDALYGVGTIGLGLILFGASLIAVPICTKLVKLMWKLFTGFFSWLKRLFSGKEKTK